MPKVIISVSLCILCYYAFICYNFSNTEVDYFGHFDSEVSVAPTRGKIVLFAATPIFGTAMDNYYLNACPKERTYCRISTDFIDHFQAAAVLFHNRDFKVNKFPRRRGQVYVWLTSESPTNEKILVPESYINWTMSYRTDSDIWYPYSIIKPLEKENIIDWDSIWRNKTKTASWLVSNCVTGNNRLEVVKRLIDKGLKVDVWGKCGKPLPSCPRQKGLGCATEHLSKYKFYMSLENSNCPDYVTEKFWTSLTMYRAVPIVMERRVYANYGIPPSAFIAIDDFETLDEMISYVERVSVNKTAYLEHHRWRKTHRVIDSSSSSSTGFCELCRRLKKNTTPAKSYKDLSSWYSKSTCDNHSISKQYLGWSFVDRAKCYVKSAFRLRSLLNC